MDRELESAVKDLLSRLERLAEFLKIRPIYWDFEAEELVWLDTRLLPFKEVYRRSSDYRRVAEAIRAMEIRGAPAIGVAAAFALAMAAMKSRAESPEEFKRDLGEAKRILASTRPTAVNLFWALERVHGALSKALEKGVDEAKIQAFREAFSIYVEDVESNISIGRHGSRLIDNGDSILTHCNTGALATAGFGTALGIIRYAWYEGKNIRVYATETRPVLQGARLTVWELKKEGIPVTLITDGMAGLVLNRGLADKVIVGADRIVLTGHTANKIGTYMIALAAKHNEKPFYVAAPTSTIDPRSRPEDIVIEERDPNEVRTVMGDKLITVSDVEVFNPAFDVTPPELISAFITEKGVVEKPFEENFKRLLES